MIYLYKNLNNLNKYSVITDYLNDVGNRNLLSNNKFNTKSMVGYSYQDLINNNYNNIYHFEKLSPTNYRILNVNKIN